MLSAELRVNSKYDDARERYAVSLEKGAGSLKKRVHLQEWHIHSPVAEAASDEKGKPTYSLHMVLRRKAGHFKNIMILMGLMATVALGCAGAPVCSLCLLVMANRDALLCKRAFGWIEIELTSLFSALTIIL